MGQAQMSKQSSALAVLAVVTFLALAGCTGTPSGTAPSVSGDAGNTSASTATTPASGATPTATVSQGTSPATTTGQGSPSKSFAKANSIPFPVAVGNTWVYRTVRGVAAGRTTNRIVAAGAGSAGYQVTVTSTVNVAGTATAVQPVYVFYPDGSIGYPLPAVGGLPVTVSAVRWPDAAALASGRAYHSVLRVQVAQTGQYQNADVTVQGGGTTSVTVPAGTYQASVVHTTITAKAGTIVETAWIVQGVGTVKTVVLVRTAGKPGLTATDELLSFTKAASVVGDGS